MTDPFSGAVPELVAVHVAFFGIVMLLIFVPANSLDPSDVTLSGSVIEVNDSQSLKAEFPIDVTVNSPIAEGTERYDADPL